MPFKQGENVGPYRIIEQLGQGGMATVFKAYHPALDRYVAIKVLHPAFMQDPQFLQRFQREARVVAKLDNANIVPVFDYADHDGQPYLVMKFIEGETLKAVLDRGWPSKARILEIVNAVGNALTYAHGKGVLHRDVKPSNILLTEDGGVYLADFGLARIAEAGQSTLSGDQLLGTPHYISPEQARGEQNLDEGTDIYSFGIVLYQLAVGRVPYNSDTPFSIIHDHIYTPLPLPRTINEKIPENLEKVLLKALAKDREDRFSSVEELVRVFDHAVQGLSPWEPEQAVTATPAIPVQGQAAESEAVRVEAAPASGPRRWAWVAGGLLFSLASIGAFMVAMAGAMEGTAAPLEPITQFSNDQPYDPFAQFPNDQPHDPFAQFPMDQPIEPDFAPIPAAWERVNHDPDNPDAHLELAEALAAEGDFNPAKSEFTRASELYMDHADYLSAADAIITGLKTTGGSPEDDFRVSNLLSQALFLGAESDGLMFPAIDALYELSPDWAPLEALDARSLLYVEQDEAALGILDRVLTSRPEDMLANAVMIDAHHLSGNNEMALELANELLQRPRKPPWLSEHLHGYQTALSS